MRLGDSDQRVLVDRRSGVLTTRHQDALKFAAPFVLDRLVQDRTVDSLAEAAELFTEVKKYLVLCDAAPGRSFGMHSARVDAAWHAFILFTAEYTEFGARCCGNYIHHAPIAGERESTSAGATFDEFRMHYEEFYGQSLPEIWYDEVAVGPNRRVINDAAGRLSANFDGRIVELQDGAGASLLCVDALALNAVRFIANMPDFYVRELPGDLTDEEKVGLVRTLVRGGVLRVAP
jgi:hypothetical protein